VVEQGSKAGSPVGVVGVFGEPFGGVVGRDVQRSGEHVGGLGGGGEPDHGAGAVVRLPRLAECGQRGGVPGPGRAYQHVELSSGGGDREDGGRLVVG
jgi:hypothetical protein